MTWLQGATLSWGLYIAGASVALAGVIFGGGRPRIRQTLVHAAFGLSLLAGLAGLVCFALPEPQAAPNGVVPLWPGLGSQSDIPFALTYRPDGLGRLFHALVSAFAAVTALFSFGYLSPAGVARTKFPLRDTDGRSPKANLAYIPLSFNVFLLAMSQIVLADNAFLLLLSWEVMTLSSAVFVYFKQHYLRERVSTGAGPTSEQRTEMSQAQVGLKVYIVSGQVSTALLTVGVLLVGWLGHGHAGIDAYSFAAYGGILGSTGEGLRAAVFSTLFCGFAVKAAVVPFHLWLPFINFSSPGNAHALHSSVMVKIGIYGMARLLFDFLDPAPFWAGVTVLGFAGVTAVAGVQFALAEHDLKRALAYHTVENIGLILAGLAVAALRPWVGAPIAALALMAALLHVVNHAFFKGLLLLATATFELHTDTVHLERLRGLFRTTRLAAVFFLVGALAIAGVPPLNGFASEWLTFQSLIGAGRQVLQPGGAGGSSIAILVAVVIAFAAIAYACAGTALCFAKICSLTLTGLPTGPKRSLNDVPRSTRFWLHLPMLLLAAGCAALGLFPGLGLRLVSSAIPASWPAGQSAVPWSALTDAAGHSTIVPGALGAGLLLAATLGWLLLVRLRRPSARRSTLARTQPTPGAAARRPPDAVVPWDCGSTVPPAGAHAGLFTGLYQETALFGRWRRSPVRAAEAAPAAASHPTGAAAAFSEAAPGARTAHALHDILDRPPGYAPVREGFRAFLGRLVAGLDGASDKTAKVIQSGDLRRYLAYVLGTALLAIVLFLVWR